MRKRKLRKDTKKNNKHKRNAITRRKIGGGAQKSRIVTGQDADSGPFQEPYVPAPAAKFTTVANINLNKLKEQYKKKKGIIRATVKRT